MILGSLVRNLCYLIGPWGSLCRKSRPPLSLEAVNHLLIKEIARKRNEKVFKGGEDIPAGPAHIVFIRSCFHVIAMLQGGKR